MQNPFSNRSDGADHDRDDEHRMSDRPFNAGDERHGGEARAWREPSPDHDRGSHQGRDRQRSRGGGIAMAPGGPGGWGNPGQGQVAVGSQLYGGPAGSAMGGGMQSQSRYGGYSGHAGGGFGMRQSDVGPGGDHRAQDMGGGDHERRLHGQDDRHGGEAYRRESHAPGAQIWDGGDNRTIRQGSGGTYGMAGRQDHHDLEPDYLHWRETQMRGLDDDYRAWREERRTRFAEDFNTWRSRRDESVRRNNLSATGVQDVADGGKGQSDESDAVRNDGDDKTR